MFRCRGGILHIFHAGVHLAFSPAHAAFASSPLRRGALAYPLSGISFAPARCITRIPTPGAGTTPPPHAPRVVQPEYLSGMGR